MQPFPPVQAIELAQGNTRQSLSKKITHLLESCFPRRRPLVRLAMRRVPHLIKGLFRRERRNHWAPPVLLRCCVEVRVCQQKFKRMESGSDYGTGDFCEKDCVHEQGTHREVGGMSAKTTDRVTKNSGKMGTAPSSNVMGCQQQYNNSTPQPILYRLCSMKPISYINSRGQPSHFP